MNIDLSAIMPQLGLSIIFAYAVFILYRDMREDSRAREDKLLSHLDRVADTLENINERLRSVEDFVRGNDNGNH